MLLYIDNTVVVMKESKIIVEIINNKPNYDKVKHLEFIENIIKRMADNSLNMKKFSVTIFLALIVFSISNNSIIEKFKEPICYLLIFNTIVFASLDAYYLYLERLYRELYKKVNRDEYTSYVLAIEHQFLESLKAYGSFSIWGFYSFMMVFINILNDSLLVRLSTLVVDFISKFR